MKDSFTETQAVAGAGGQPLLQAACLEPCDCSLEHTSSQNLVCHKDTKKGKEGIHHLDTTYPQQAES